MMLPSPAGVFTLQEIVLWPAVRRFGKQSYLCAAMLVFLLMGPVIGATETALERVLIYSLLILVFVTGPLSASRTRLELGITFALGVALFVSAFSGWLFPYFAPFQIGLSAVFFAYLAFLVGRNLLQVSTDVSTDTLWMAVNVYVLTGLCFAFLYAGVAAVDPDAFVGKFQDLPLRDQTYGFIYFSFVTLTTLGYGDLTPNNLAVGTLAYLEALFGQLFIAIMVARLVGLYAVRNR